MKNIPLIIPNFNQLFYLKNLINWWRWYFPQNDVFIVDNGSTYKPLEDWYYRRREASRICFYEENNCAMNLADFIDKKIKNKYEYYVISDPDIMPHTATPPNFLEIFKAAIDSGYHRAGFGLITNDIPDWLHDKAMIVGNEQELKASPVSIEFGGKTYDGFRAPLDTTFCLYKSSDGWQAPMPGDKWGNCLRLFEAFHLGWYIHPDFVNAEMDNYFRTSKYRDLSPISAGKNNNKPKQYL